MLRSKNAGTMVAALAALLLSILDQTIVASAAAPIARDLHAGGATDRIPWLIAAYTLSATCVGPLYGKLADRLGSRPTFLACLALFLAGSALCATAGSVQALIAFRAVQGIGGGGLMTVAIVVLGQLRADARDAGDERRASGGNLFAAALVGIGLVLGPTVGGQIVEHVSWRWVFAVNLPLGGAALALAWRCLPRRRPLTRGAVDGIGAGLLAAFAAALLLACQWGSTAHAWESARVLALAAVSLAAFVAFVGREVRAAEPLVPLGVIGARTVRVIALLQLLTGIGMTGGALYVTFDLQLVHGISPAGTGVRLAPMAVGLACGALAGQRLLQGRTVPLTRAIAVSSALAAAAFTALAMTGTATPYGLLAGLLWLLGCGIGVGLGTEVLVLQRTVDPAHLGIATSSVRFAEQLGTSLAAAGLGVLFATRVGARGAAGPHGAVLATAVAGAVRPVFLVSAAALALAAIASQRLPIVIDREDDRGHTAAAASPG